MPSSDFNLVQIHSKLYERDEKTYEKKTKFYFVIRLSHKIIKPDETLSDWLLVHNATLNILLLITVD